MRCILYFRPTSWELKEKLEGEQEDVDSYLDAAKFICGAEDVTVYDPVEEEAEEEAFEEQLTESDIYTSVSMDESSEIYEEPQYNDAISSEKDLPLLSTTPMPKSSIQFSSKV